MTILRSRQAARHLAVTVVTSALCACAWLPLQVDRSARAPSLSGFGHSNMSITTSSDAARRDFAQGMEQAYAFNEVEAVRAFKAALAQDPGCAMCAWGVAYQLGPNIALARAEPVAARIIGAHAGDGYVDKMLRSIASVARQRLRAEVALAEGRGDAAVDAQLQTIALAKDIDEAEPPLLAADTHLTLGDMQLRAKRWADAEQTFRADLADRPKSGWAQRGLALALRAQGRGAEADALRAELRRDWARADPLLLSRL